VYLPDWKWIPIRKGLLLMSNKDCLLSNIDDVRNVLSAPRLATYEDALKQVSPNASDTTDVLNLYLWNAEMSGALLFPMQLCEVVIRNAVSQAIASVYEEDWPWNQTFVGSLANNEKQDLSKGIVTFEPSPSMTGRVVAAMTLNTSGRRCSLLDTTTGSGIRT